MRRSLRSCRSGHVLRCLRRPPSSRAFALRFRQVPLFRVERRAWWFQRSASAPTPPRAGAGTRRALTRKGFGHRLRGGARALPGPGTGCPSNRHPAGSAWRSEAEPARPGEGQGRRARDTADIPGGIEGRARSAAPRRRKDRRVSEANPRTTASRGVLSARGLRRSFCCPSRCRRGARGAHQRCRPHSQSRRTRTLRASTSPTLAGHGNGRPHPQPPAPRPHRPRQATHPDAGPRHPQPHRARRTSPDRQPHPACSRTPPAVRG